MRRTSNARRMRMSVVSSSVLSAPPNNCTDFHIYSGLTCPKRFMSPFHLHYTQSVNVEVKMARAKTFPACFSTRYMRTCAGCPRPFCSVYVGMMFIQQPCPSFCVASYLTPRKFPRDCDPYRRWSLFSLSLLPSVDGCSRGKERGRRLSIAANIRGQRVIEDGIPCGGFAGASHGCGDAISLRNRSSSTCGVDCDSTTMPSPATMPRGLITVVQ